MQKKNCRICSREYEKKVFVSKKNWKLSKYCSWECLAKSKFGNKNRLGISYPAWNKGLPGLKGEANPSWKGEKATYSAHHHWIRTIRGRPNRCEHCDRSGFSEYNIHWANIDHKYSRNPEDWLRLCKKCHIRHDKTLK